MGNGDKDNDFADGGPTLIKLDTSLTIDLDTAYLLCSLQANSIEPNIGRKPNVIQAMILLFPYDFICLFSRLSFVHTLTIYYKQY
jgi:hypothetical protein